MNILTISGNVGREPELRSTQSGEKVLSFSFANKVGFGEKAVTQWYDVSIWGKRAESLNGKISKGEKLILSGEQRLVEYQTKAGGTDKKNTLRVSELEFAGGKSDSASTGGYAQDHQAPLGGGGGQDYGARPATGGAGGRGGGKPAFDQDLDDSIPFIRI